MGRISSAAACAAQYVGRIRDVLQFLEHEPGNKQRPFDEPRFADIGNTTINDDACIDYLGLASGFENEIGYSAEEFIGFWKKGIDYIVSINKNGKFFHEREARIMLQKILSNIDPNYSDLRSPCGAAVSQLAYDYNGNIYTCDEGRMLGDDTFLTGNVGKDSYQDIISNNKVKAMLVSSCLDNLSCDYCVYKTYCGVCPVRNYAYYGNLFPQMNNTDWCRIKTAQFDYLFEKIRDEKTKKIFEKWARETQYG